MAISIGSQQAPTVHGALGDLEHLISVRSDLIKGGGYYDDFNVLDFIILQKLEIMKGATPANTEIKILDDLDRLTSLRAKLNGNVPQYDIWGDAPTKYYPQYGGVLDDTIIKNLNGLTVHNTAESFGKALSKIERLVKMLQCLRGYDNGKIQDILKKKLESLALHDRKGWDDSNTPEHSEAGVDTPDETEKGSSVQEEVPEPENTWTRESSSSAHSRKQTLQLKRQNQILTVRLEDKSLEIDRLQQRNDELTATNQDLEQKLTARLEDKSLEIDRLQQQNDNLMATNQDLEEKLAGMRNTLRNVNKALGIQATKKV